MAEQGYWTKRRASRRSILATGGSLAVATGAAITLGCCDDDDSGGQQAGSAQATPAAVQAKRGGNLALVLTSGEQPHHDVMLTTTGPLHTRGSGVVYSRLVRQKLGADITSPGINVIPESDVAASWEQVDDLTYVFKL